MKLGRNGFVPSFLQKGLMIEPNFGPFPQYNIIVEDEPMQDYLSAISSKGNRRYFSPARQRLKKLLEKATNDLLKTETLLLNPRTRKAASMIWSKVPSSFMQDHEQFVEDNAAPYQEIVVHPESRVPRGGDAPIMPTGGFKMLDLDRTAQKLELQVLAPDELKLFTEAETFAKDLNKAVRKILKKQQNKKNSKKNR